MNSGKIKKVGFIAISIFVSGCLLVSTIGHLSQPYAFLLSILRYDVVSGGFARSVALILPAFQFVLAISMISLQTPRFSTFAATMLILLFTLLQASALIRGLDISCGCFGSFNEPISWLTIGRNVVLLSGCVWLCLNLPEKEAVKKTAHLNLEATG